MPKSKKTATRSEAPRKKKESEPVDNSGLVPEISASTQASQTPVARPIPASPYLDTLAFRIEELKQNVRNPALSAAERGPLEATLRELERLFDQLLALPSAPQAEEDRSGQTIHTLYLLSVVYPDVKQSQSFSTAERTALDKLFQFMFAHALEAKTYPVALPTETSRVLQAIRAGEETVVDFSPDVTLTYAELQKLLSRLASHSRGQPPKLSFPSILKSTAADFKPSRSLTRRAAATPSPSISGQTTMPTTFRELNQFVDFDHGDSLRKYVVVPASGISFTCPSVIFDPPTPSPVSEKPAAAPMDKESDIVVISMDKEPLAATPPTDEYQSTSDYAPTEMVEVMSNGVPPMMPVPYPSAWPGHPAVPNGALWMGPPDSAGGSPGSHIEPSYSGPGSEGAPMAAPYMMYSPYPPVNQHPGGGDGADAAPGSYPPYPPYSHYSPAPEGGDMPVGMMMGYPPPYDPNWPPHAYGAVNGVPDEGLAPPTDGGDLTVPRHQSTSSRSSSIGNPATEGPGTSVVPHTNGYPNGMYPPYSGAQQQPQQQQMPVYPGQGYPGMPLPPGPPVYGHPHYYYQHTSHPNGPMPPHHQHPHHQHQHPVHHPSAGVPGPNGHNHRQPGGYSASSGTRGGRGGFKPRGAKAGYYNSPRGGSPNFRGGYRGANNYQARPVPPHPAP
ncbi:hypothetical protein BJ085DRAFT_32320 [Dimargaris cristalligena]|uniref:Uncharacterized protein n=1 Tax=Dimargaris cristalligena TaxID=215637 RepID=A0A4Q0A2E2_9FUNG|nr:hypothetical protein BJ085DRAFT_32320 [Dimargaris cristalligena]|eukprot:RKP40275.1 hypothetical protein BJ085DRAFT_32320 [Dimargaris cristalligena]